MSRIGNRIITIPNGVEIKVENNVVTVTGPKGELSTKTVNGITIKVEGDTLEVIRANEALKPMHGTVNSNIYNLIEGVTKGYEKQLEMVGVGYRFALKGNNIVISAGYSHPVELAVPNGLTVDVPSNTELTIKGIDKILVGEFAANIRKVRAPEPYKGKGIRYKDEHIIRKEGKKAA